MTKSELIEAVASRLKLPKGKAELVVNCVFESMVDSLNRNEGIEIRGFGSFTVRQYKAYEGRNPRTGAPVHVKPKRLPFFKVGKDLRERVNLENELPSPPSQSSRPAPSPTSLSPSRPAPSPTTPSEPAPGLPRRPEATPAPRQPDARNPSSPEAPSSGASPAPNPLNPSDPHSR